MQTVVLQSPCFHRQRSSWRLLPSPVQYQLSTTVLKPRGFIPGHFRCPPVSTGRGRHKEILCAAASSSKPGTLKQEIEQSNALVYDKLIDVFKNRKPQEWRKLIAFSKQWPKLAQGVLSRLDEIAEVQEDKEARVELRKLRRRLGEVHEEVESYRTLLQRFKESAPQDWEGLVGRSRALLGVEFFEYVSNVAKSSENSKEQEELVTLVTRVAALVEAYDKVEADVEAMKRAAMKFQSILQVESMEEAEKKIDVLAASGQLDPALMLIMAKAYQGAKDTDYTKEEVKDIMAHLYFKAKEQFARQQPTEVRILKHLLSLDDPLERNSALADAFTPGVEGERGGADYVTTTPDKLLATLAAVLSMYDTQRGASSMVGEAAKLMHPAVIHKMRELQSVVRKQYM